MSPTPLERVRRFSEQIKRQTPQALLDALLEAAKRLIEFRVSESLDDDQFESVGEQVFYQCLSYFDENIVLSIFLEPTYRQQLHPTFTKIVDWHIDAVYETFDSDSRSFSDNLLDLIAQSYPTGERRSGRHWRRSKWRPLTEGDVWLIDELLDGTRERFPWMTRRLLFAFAFRPDLFENRNHMKLSRFFPGQQWQSLYRKVEIRRGNGGKRVLHVPTPPLKRAQKTLLKKFFADEGLSDDVFGCRSGPNHTIFQMAKRHIGQRLVFKCDISSFFPSITTDSVFRMLTDLGGINVDVSCEQPAITSDLEEIAPLEKRLTWRFPLSSQARAFLAKLVTHNGRLPQGAPTSPLIAHLVFGDVDKKLKERLRAKCGKIVYTRYVDDIVVSLSHAESKAGNFRTAQELAERVLPIVREELQRAGFSLNEGKTRATDINDAPHSLLGLRVSESSVFLKRKRRREIRSEAYKLRTGFVRAADRHIGQELVRDLRIKRRPGQHVRRHRANRRRSMEEQAAEMLLTLDPGLVALVVPSEKAIRRLQLEVADYLPYVGTDARQYVERCLSMLWDEQCQAEAIDEHTVIMVREGNEIARLESTGKSPNRPMGGFFLLPMKTAMACVVYWQRLRGMASGLAVPAGPEFLTILENRRALEDALSQIEIPLPSRAQSAEEEGRPVDHTALAPAGVLQLCQALRTTITQLQGTPVLSQDTIPWNDVVEDFERECQNVEELGHWITTVRSKILAQCKRLPNNHPDPEANIRIVNLLGDRLKGDRIGPYESEREFLSKNVDSVFQDGAVEDLKDSDVSQLQRALCDHLIEAFSLPDQWANGDESSHFPTVENTFATNWEHRLNNAVDDLSTFHGQARWQSNGTRLFKEALGDVTKNPFDSLRKPITDQGDAVWQALFDFGVQLVRNTIENLEQSSPEADADQVWNDTTKRWKKDLHALKRLRNRGAHGPSLANVANPKATLADWRGLQSYIAQTLGRPKPPKRKDQQEKNLFHEDDLKLSAIEATQLKVHFVEVMAELLEQRFTKTTGRP